MIDHLTTHEAKRRQAARRQAMRRIFECVREPAFIVDGLGGHVVDANLAACVATAVEHNRLIGSQWSWLALRFDETTVCDVDGRYFVVIVHASRETRSASQCFQLDALTGLATRESLRTSGLPDARQTSRTMFFIDLDGFKQVNDVCGHLAGDHVLTVVARRISDCVRPCDLVVRYGGDEFIVIVDAIRRRRDLDQLARRISRALRRPIPINGYEVTVSASIGIAKGRGVETTVDVLIAKADRAMYRAKRKNRSERTLITTCGHDSHVTQ